MTQATEEEVSHADYYQCSGGYTIDMTVCEDGAIVRGEDMGFSKQNPPLSEEEQEARFGQVLYREYTPDEEELKNLEVTSVVRGMQSPGQPVVLPPPTGTADLNMLSRDELRARAKKVGLNFPADTDRDQMIGAIEKKEKEEQEAAQAKAAEATGTTTSAPPEEEEETTSA